MLGDMNKLTPSKQTTTNKRTRFPGGAVPCLSHRCHYLSSPLPHYPVFPTPTLHWHSALPIANRCRELNYPTLSPSPIPFLNNASFQIGWNFQSSSLLRQANTKVHIRKEERKSKTALTLVQSKPTHLGIAPLEKYFYTSEHLLCTL